MAEKYKAEAIQNLEYMDNIKRDVIQKKFIMEVINRLPLEKLKDLVNYEEIEKKKTLTMKAKITI